MSWVLEGNGHFLCSNPCLLVSLILLICFGNQPLFTLHRPALSLLKTMEKKVLFIQTNLIGNGRGWGVREGKKWSSALLENESGKRCSEEWGAGARCWAGWSRGHGHPTQTHIKRQLKKASSWCGKFQIYNNRALFIIGSRCAVGESARGWEQGRTGKMERPSPGLLEHLWEVV